MDRHTHHNAEIQYLGHRSLATCPALDSSMSSPFSVAADCLRTLIIFAGPSLLPSGPGAM